MEIKTQRRFYFYIGIFFALLFYWGFGFILFCIAFDEGIDYTILVMALLMFYLGWYTWRNYLRNVPVVRMSDEGIRYKRKWYGWGQVKLVDFEKKQPYKYLWTRNEMDAITLSFDDGSTLYLFDKMYRNPAAIRSYLQSRVRASLHVQHETPVEPKLNEAIIKKGNRVLIALYLLLVVIVTASSLAIEFAELPDMMRILLYTPLVTLSVVFMFGMRRYLRKILREASEKGDNS